MKLAAVDGTLGQLPLNAGADLVAAVRGPGLPARDVRVRAIWDQLRGRGLLDQDPWVRWALRRIWDTGLAPGYRPRTASRLETALQNWGLLTPLTSPTPAYAYSSMPGYPRPWGPGLPQPWYPAPSTLTPDSARDLVLALRQGTLGARDPRVAALWRQLRTRVAPGTAPDPMVRQLLLSIWRSGASGVGPDAARRVAALLRESGLLVRTGRRPTTRQWRGSRGVRRYGYGPAGRGSYSAARVR